MLSVRSAGRPFRAMPAAPPSVAVHPGALPAAQHASLLASLGRRELPARLLYQAPGQAQRWLAYHDACSPSRTDPALGALYGQAYRAAAAGLGTPTGMPGPWVLLSLGCGGGRKDAALLASLPAAQAAQARYAPVDASADLVRAASQHVAARCPGLPMLPLVADLEAQPRLAEWLEQQGWGAVPRLVGALGLLPNLRTEPLLATLRGLLRPGDALLLSANLSPRGLGADRPLILPQYDNPLACAWYRGLLEHLGLGAQDYALQVDAVPLAADEPDAHWQVRVQALLRRSVHLSVEGAPLALAAGDALQVFHSQRFTAARLSAVLRQAGLPVREHWLHAGGEEGVFHCALP